MAVNLQKGQRVDLTKGNSGLSRLLVGLGWDAVKKGFFRSTVNIDCDASVIMLDANGKFTKKENVIYFGNLQSACGSIKHSGDNLTGEGDGDDEQVFVELNKIPQDITRLVFVVNIYDAVNRKQDFGLIQNAFIRVVDMGSNQELLKYDLSENYAGKTALIVGEIYRHNTDWKFAAVGEGTNDISISQMLKRYS